MIPELSKSTSGHRGSTADGLHRRLVRGGAWALAGRVLALPTGLLVPVLLTRLLPPAEVGAFFLAMAVAWPLAMIAQGGMGRAMVSLVAAAMASGRPQAARRAVQVGLTLTIAGGTLVAVVIAGPPGEWLITRFRDGALLLEALVPLGLLILTFALIDLCAETLRGYQALPAASLLGQLLLYRILLVLGLAAIWLGGLSPGLGDAFRTAVFAGTLTLAVGLLLLGRRYAATAAGGRPWRIREVLRQGPPFLIVRLNLWLMSGADLWVLGLFRPLDEVAVYAAASRTVLLANLLPAVCNAVLAPVIAELHSKRRTHRLEPLLQTSASLGAMAAAALVGVFWMLGAPLLGLVFTDAYVEGHRLLVILALGRLVQTALGPAWLVLNMTDRQREVSAVTTAASIVTILAYFAIAPRFGSEGVAVVTAVSLVAANAAMTLVVHRRLRIASWATASLARAGPLIGAANAFRRPEG